MCNVTVSNVREGYSVEDRGGEEAIRVADTLKLKASR